MRAPRGGNRLRASPSAASRRALSSTTLIHSSSMTSGYHPGVKIQRARGVKIQCARTNSWKYAISAACRPKVSRDYFNFKMGTAVAEPNDCAQEPDFSRWMKSEKECR